jgi:hypothetical protein
MNQPPIQALSFPAHPEAYSFVSCDADWEGEWPESPEHISVEVHIHPVVGFVVYYPDLEDCSPVANPVYLKDGRVEVHENSLVEDEQDMPLGAFPAPVYETLLKARARKKSFARLRWLKQRLAAGGNK